MKVWSCGFSFMFCVGKISKRFITLIKYFNYWCWLYFAGCAGELQDLVGKLVSIIFFHKVYCQLTEMSVSSPGVCSCGLWVSSGSLRKVFV